MTYRVFEVPEYEELFEALGVAPESVEGEEAQRLKFEMNEELLAVTFDIPGRSLHCAWSQASRVIAEIFREGAVRLSVRSSGDTRIISVDFETDNDRGLLEIQTSPFFAIRDRLILR